MNLCARRLLKDLKQVLEDPLPNVVALPKDETDLFLWYGNVRGDSGSYVDVPVHFSIQFNQGYPSVPPLVRLYSPVPHPNITRVLVGNAGVQQWKLAVWDCIPNESSWSSAYTVQSILIQLQAFLLDEDLLYAAVEFSPAEAVVHALSLELPSHGHTGKDPMPAFPLPETIAKAQAIRLQLVVSHPAVKSRKKAASAGPSNLSAILAAYKSPGGSAGHVIKRKEASEDDKKGKRPRVDEGVAEEVPLETLVKNMLAEFRGKIAEGAAGGPSVERFPAAGKPSPWTAKMGLPKGDFFDGLPIEVMSIIVCMLPATGISALSQTCKGLCAVCEDGALWRSLMMRDFPASTLTASTMSDWKHAFLLQANNIVGELQCFYSKDSYEDAVLGLPYRFTINPKKNMIDVIQADPELLSVAAFKHSGARKSVIGEDVAGVLPLYITEGHFKRAVHYTDAVLRHLTCKKNPTPGEWLDIIPRLLNTTVVLICDKGVSASYSALNLYCSIHRLFIALIEHHNLWEDVTARVGKFAESRANRTKEHCPNLGWFIPLVAADKEHNWRNICSKHLSEAFDRHVLWVCKHDPSMVAKFQATSAGPDEALLSTAFSATQVSLRLLAFHVAFMDLVAKPLGCTIEQAMDSLDALYGRPGIAMQAQFRVRVQRILEMTCWEEFFGLVGLAPPTETELTRWLRSSWINSLEKGYHKQGMDFSKIHASGVSAILLKGQSYTAPPNMKRIDMLEKWGWIGDVRYLDASCILVAQDRSIIQTIDYVITESSLVRNAAGCAVIHSGDVMTQQTGTHTISIHLDRIGEIVSEMFITMSSWQGARLSQIRQPFVSVKDPVTGMDLCKYYLEDQARAVLEASTSVVMCRIYRGAAGRWSVEAIGRLGLGCADNYGPIHEYIASR